MLTQEVNMKALNHSIINYFKVLIIILIFASILNSQSTLKTIKHTVDPTDNTSGKFTVSSGDKQDIKTITVKELSVSISSSNDKKLIFAADLTVLSDGKSAKDIKASVKSYANTDYVRAGKEEKNSEEEIVTDENQDESGDESGSEETTTEEEKDPYEGVSDEEIPIKMYLEIIVDGSESTYDFYDKEDLEPIVKDINAQYNTNLEVTGSGRNVSVKKSAPKKTETQKEVNKRITITKQQIDDGSSSVLAGFDIAKLESEILKDKILNKNQIKNFSIILEKEEIYINGNKISDKLTSKYRKIFNNFSFDFIEE